MQEHISIKSRQGVHLLPVRDIDWVEANQDYAALHVGAKSWLIRGSMHALATAWASAGFVRIHRSTLLNAGRVRELRPLSKGEFTVVLVDGTQLKLSRSYRDSAAALVKTPPAVVTEGSWSRRGGEVFDAASRATGNRSPRRLPQF